MSKRFAFLLLILCVLLGSSFAAHADENTLILPLDTENTHAVLLCHEDHYALMGGSDVSVITAQLEALHIPRLACVVSVCDHTEHIAALADLAQQYGVPWVMADTPFALADTEFAWMENGLTFDTDATAYAFGAEEPVPNHIAFRCDGSLWGFQAETNESAVNVRKEPSTQAQSVGKFYRGELLTVVSMLRNAKDEVWYRVLLPDQTEGYIRYDLLRYVSADELALRSTAVQLPDDCRYIGNTKTKVFHLLSCDTLPAPKNQVYFSSRSYALSIGYRPCRNCDP